MAPFSAPQPIFAGEFRHTVDAKNRVTIPARWRRAEIDEFFALADVDGGFLMMMPPEVIRGVAEKVEQDPRLAPQDRRKFIRQFYAQAQHVASDKAGRIVLPEEQCRQLNLRGEVVLVGSHSRFEVWSAEAWTKVLAEDTPTFRHVLSLMGI
jgi:MraZ protein